MKISRLLFCVSFLFVSVIFSESWSMAQIILNDDQPLQALSFDAPSTADKSHMYIPKNFPTLKENNTYNNSNSSNYFLWLTKDSADFNHRITIRPPMVACSDQNQAPRAS